MRTRIRTLAAAFALAALATMLPQVASPASAGPIVNAFHLGDIVKIKTTWGGGWVTNFGGSSGSFVEGRIAQIHWNSSWDNANRFEVVKEGSPQAGQRWFKLRNRWSGLCMAATDLSGGGYVTQRSCDSDHSSRYFAVVNGIGGDAPIRNLWFHQNGLDMVVTQQTFEWVGSHIVMSPRANPVDHSRQRWVVQTCRVGGSELRDC